MSLESVARLILPFGVLLAGCAGPGIPGVQQSGLQWEVKSFYDRNAMEQSATCTQPRMTPVRATVVDLKAGNLSYALDLFERIGVLEAARNGVFNMGLVHVVGPSIASLDEIGEIAKYLNGIQYLVARNTINETNFFEWDEATQKKYFSAIPKAQEITVPKLNEMAYEQVDLAGVTFSNFIANKTANGDAAKFSFVLRGYVKKWCAEIDEEFARVPLLQDLATAP